MKLYRFSPIKNESELMEAIKHIHFACFELCKQSFGKYLSVAGNMGVFCHYKDEYQFLTELRKKLTEESDNVNQKYFRLHNPIVIPAHDDMPETTYIFLYVRKPDSYRFHVGDVDFVLEEEKYQELKKSLQAGKIIKGARIFERPDLDMVELYDPDVDALGYVSPRAMTEKVRIKQQSWIKGSDTIDTADNTIFTANAVVFRDIGRGRQFLIVQENDGQWGLAGGAKDVDDLDVTATLKRELREELSLGPTELPWNNLSISGRYWKAPEEERIPEPMTSMMCGMG